MGQALPFCVECADKRGCDSCTDLHNWIIEHMEPRWISVEDRLPETDVWVAVWYMDKDGDYFPTVGACRDGGDGLTYWETDVDINERAYPPEKITHWMPLPEPPKEES